MLVTAYQAGKHRIASRLAGAVGVGEEGNCLVGGGCGLRSAQAGLGALDWPRQERQRPAHVNHVPGLEERKQAAATM